jgi:hypothetical protein
MGSKELWHYKERDMKLVRNCPFDYHEHKDMVSEPEIVSR